MKRKKTILIDLECLYANPKQPFSFENLPAPKAGLHDFLSLLASDYRLLLRSRQLIGLGALWCVKNEIESYFEAAIKTKRRCYFHIYSENYSDLDLESILLYIENFIQK